MKSLKLKKAVTILVAAFFCVAIFATLSPFFFDYIISIGFIILIKQNVNDETFFLFYRIIYQMSHSSHYINLVFRFIISALKMMSANILLISKNILLMIFKVFLMGKNIFLTRKNIFPISKEASLISGNILLSSFKPLLISKNIFLTGKNIFPISKEALLMSGNIFLTSKEVLLMIFKPLPMSKKAKSIDNQLLLYFHTLFRQRLSAPFTMLRMRYGGGVQPMLFGTQTKS